ncbi:hypothetical protein [Neptuniibacter sp. QD37_11]|uniref:hypothetical protein n=1 Tax=Neptuniibacter sp. QD37_11 TaxID=3398209 RepID=UPI0039F4B074
MNIVANNEMPACLSFEAEAVAVNGPIPGMESLSLWTDGLVVNIHQIHGVMVPMRVYEGGVYQVDVSVLEVADCNPDARSKISAEAAMFDGVGRDVRPTDLSLQQVLVKGDFFSVESIYCRDAFCRLRLFSGSGYRVVVRIVPLGV